MTDYRTTYSWKESLDLGPHLVRLAEALPDHEQSGMVLQLHQIMLDLPTRVAQDLAAGTRTREDVLYRLAAVVELIDRVYPALDTAEVRKLQTSLETRLLGDSFAEVVEVPAPIVPAADEPVAEVGAQEAVDATFGSTPVAEPQVVQVAPEEPVAPTTISVSAAPSAPTVVAPSVDIAVNDPATVNVQPDSVQ